MLGAIKYALANLANPAGRDARQTFWYWVLAVVVLRFAASMALSAPLTLKIMATAMHAAQNGAAQDPAAMQAMTTQLILAELPKIVWGGVAIGLVSMALLAASLVRRLHDSGLSGWLVLVPGAIYAFVLARMPAQVGRVADVLATLDPANPPNAGALIRAEGAMALLPYVSLLLAVWFGMRTSTPGPNRFGDAPVRF